ncbi:MAG TPA: hypothetical protein VNI34_04370 [Candidatus Nitrosotalea sp.]|nr:hypothetical protein [Candidatus Nitrosotalea sp.]
MRRLSVLMLALLMVVFGFGVYAFLGHTRRSTVPETTHVTLPKKIAFTLPGTIVTVSSGQLFNLTGGRFSPLGPPGSWSQPAFTPDDQQMVAVKRTGNYSDLYLLSSTGAVKRRLTSDQNTYQVYSNLWAFYPRVSPDGKTVFFSTDRGKNLASYTVDLAIWSEPLGGGYAQRWTIPNPGTGGDVQPVPLASGGLIYTKFGIDSSGLNVSTINLRLHPYGTEVELTQPEQHCQQPALNPDGTRIAMVCAVSARVDELEVWQFDGQQLIGPPTVVFQSGLAAVPAWSPDGTGLLFYAPAKTDPAGVFQLWYSPLYGQPRQLTQSGDFDAVSPPLWIN